MIEMLGKRTIDCVRYVVAQNNEIAGIFVRPYNYVPNQTSINQERFLLERDYFLNSFDPNEMVKRFPEKTNIALDSNIKLRGDVDAFWPMVDMALEKSDINLAKIEKRVGEILSPYTGESFLLETRKSYHLLGSELLETKDEWFNFLATCLISSIVTKTPDDQPNIHEVIVDNRYIGHSMLRGSAGLRLTTCGDKTFEPRVVSVI